MRLYRLLILLGCIVGFGIVLHGSADEATKATGFVIIVVLGFALVALVPKKKRG